jgi:hypothetical protein
MITSGPPTPWRRARCSTGACIEIARIDAEHIAIRDSKALLPMSVTFTWQEWEAFRDAVKGGDFDDL